jgi:YqaJ-like viral recombinase domain
MSEHQQNTQGWLADRAGHITASRIGDVMAKGKGGKESVTRKSYLAQIVFERLSKKSLEEERPFYDIKRGKDLEGAARVSYEMRNGIVVDTAGFVEHPTLPFAGCSPDGKIGIDGLVQLKCPRRHVHLDWYMRGVVPAEHKDQMLFELACHPERQWSDFVSYVDDLDELPQYQLFQARLKPDAVRIAELELGVTQFNAEADAILGRLRDKEKSLEELLQESVSEALTAQD